ncbi:MAG: glycogen-binding domain-containing protein [Spirochaetaceae bacterium]|nr:glycogen-binding domain-containing protein [Spirochaetaceae bacterium]
MKRIITAAFLIGSISAVGALDRESYQFIDRLLTLKGPGQPELLDDGVLFTAPSSSRSVGIAFAHEGFAKVYWFQKLMKIRGDPEAANLKKEDPNLYQDSGILFYAHPFPADQRELEYRLIIDGLWTADPLNPVRRMDDRSGIYRSVVILPKQRQPPSAFDGPPGTLSFTYRASSGETITVAGDFNGWDPFMYELRETAPEFYSLILPLPPGVYHYVFYHRGQRFPDPNNPARVYKSTGEAVSEAVVR